MRLGLVLLALLFSVSRAQGSQDHAIYWLNEHGVSRMMLDGTNIEAVVDTPVVQGGDLAVASSGIYWADTGSHTINRYRFSSGHRSSSTVSSAMGIAVSGDTLVYSAGPGSVHVADLDGDVRSSLLLRATHVAILDEQIYWIDPLGLGDINRINFDGTGSERIWGPPPGQFLSDPDDLLFHERDGEIRLYWSELNGDRINSSRPDGSDVRIEHFVNGPLNIALFGDTLFFDVFDDDNLYAKNLLTGDVSILASGLGGIDSLRVGPVPVPGTAIVFGVGFAIVVRRRR